jgi:PIN domain nuclease of toxin-antitoxin system
VKRACIDTHALSWCLLSPRRLGKAAQRWLRDAEAGRTEIVIPAIVAVEVTIVREAGRRIIGVNQIDGLLEGPFVLESLDLVQAIEFVLLDTLADPFDRMIVAAARSAELPLITADQLITESALVETIWD